MQTELNRFVGGFAGVMESRLNSYELNLIKCSWEVAKQAQQNSDRVFLESIADVICEHKAELISEVKFHSEKLLRVLDYLIHNIEFITDVAEEITLLSLGYALEHIEEIELKSVQEKLIEILSTDLEQIWTRHMQQAWEKLFRLIEVVVKNIKHELKLN
ncbi:hypothetical protein EP331_12080 [bacterium]|nr:MAG: hypothetical protein EP331_12080 [bacterium]